MINSHPSTETLAEYASGALSLAQGLCIAAHLEHCHACRQQLSRLETLGARIFEAQDINNDDVESEEIKQNVFANKQSNYQVPRCLGQFIDSDYDSLDWTWVSPSIKIATLCKDKDGSNVALSCVKPGGKMPHHTHSGQELTVVLEGSFSDEDGVYRKGDFISRTVFSVAG